MATSSTERAQGMAGTEDSTQKRCSTGNRFWLWRGLAPAPQAEFSPSSLAANFEGFRRQESSLILLNLVILAALLLDHALLLPVVGVPPRLMLILFAARFAEQAVEFLWLQGRKAPLSPGSTLWYSRLSVWAHVAFAFLVLLASGTEDSHYWVLMILPIVAAGFRFTWLGTLIVALVGGVLDFFHVWLLYRERPPAIPTGYFEVSTMILLLLVVAGVVWLLASYLRCEGNRLRESLCALEAAQKQLVEKERMAAIGRLAGAIAHEIRNPVGTIVSSVAMVKQKGLDGEKQKEVCDILLSESRRLERLSGDFLTYACAREPERRPASLKTTLEYVAGLAVAQTEERGGRIRVECEEGLQASFDPFQIHQALLNLIINALDAAPSGEEIILRASRAPSDSIRIEVENAVAGPIPEGALVQLFEPFFTTKRSGTGLGLCIARRIARSHQGDVELVRNDSGRVVFALTLSGKDHSTGKGTPHGQDTHRR